MRVPRIRTIKPSFFQSEDVSSLPLRARLTWIGLWTQCDDQGRTKDNARLIKGGIWPLDDVSLRDVEDDLETLAARGRIVRYESDGRWYLAIVNWGEHQSIQKPTQSHLPAPPDDLMHVALRRSSNSAHGEPWEKYCSPTVGLQEDSGRTTGGKGRERNKEGKGKENTRRHAPTGAHDELRRESDDSDAFEAFWDAYPRKHGKAAARKAWPKACRKRSADQLIADACLWSELWSQAGIEQRFIPHASTWLNGERWNDPAPTRTSTSRSDTDANIAALLSANQPHEQHRWQVRAIE